MKLRSDDHTDSYFQSSVKFPLQSFDGPNNGLLKSLCVKVLLIQVPTIKSIFINPDF